VIVFSGIAFVDSRLKIWVDPTMLSRKMGFSNSSRNITTKAQNIITVIISAMNADISSRPSIFFNVVLAVFLDEAIYKI
jgi:hypothetical protein